MKTNYTPAAVSAALWLWQTNKEIVLDSIAGDVGQLSEEEKRWALQALTTAELTSQLMTCDTDTRLLFICQELLGGLDWPQVLALLLLQAASPDADVIGRIANQDCVIAWAEWAEVACDPQAT